jgi:beta-glucanase (GH16 family)
LWPDSDRWSEDGEIDFAEVVRPDRSQDNVTVHYGRSETFQRTVVQGDFTKWHTFAIDWAPDHIIVYLDAVAVATVTDPAAVPHSPMHLAIQQDPGPVEGWVPARNSSTPDVVMMHVDWVRVYRR